MRTADPCVGRAGGTFGGVGGAAWTTAGGCAGRVGFKKPHSSHTPNPTAIVSKAAPTATQGHDAARGVGRAGGAGARPRRRRGPSSIAVCSCGGRTRRPALLPDLLRRRLQLLLTGGALKSDEPVHNVLPDDADDVGRGGSSIASGPRIAEDYNPVTTPCQRQGRRRSAAQDIGVWPPGRSQGIPTGHLQFHRHRLYPIQRPCDRPHPRDPR